MLSRLIDRLFRCSHADYSFPITLKSDPIVTGHSEKGTYVVCLDCGQELPYDWVHMQIGRAPARPTLTNLRESVAR